MINLPTPEEFRAWQIAHYTQRLKEDNRTEAKAFLRAQLHNFKTQANDNE